MLMIPQKEEVPFAICIKSDEMECLTPGMIYQVVPDESAAQASYIRIIDREGEEYVYPAEYFMLVNFSQEIAQALSRILKNA